MKGKIPIHVRARVLVRLSSPAMLAGCRKALHLEGTNVALACWKLYVICHTCRRYDRVHRSFSCPSSFQRAAPLTVLILRCTRRPAAGVRRAVEVPRASSGVFLLIGPGWPSVCVLVPMICVGTCLNWYARLLYRMAELEACTQVCDFAPRPRPANLSCPTANLIKTLLAFDKIECGVSERAA